MTLQEMINKRNAIKAQRESINESMNQMLDTIEAEKREFTAEEQKQYAAYERSFKKAIREYDEINASVAEMREANANKPAMSENEQLRQFIRNAKKGEQYMIRTSSSANAVSTSDSGSNVQGVTIKEVIKTDRPDTDIFAATGITIPTGIEGNKIQWAYMGGVEAAFADQLASATDRKPAMGSQTPVQQRLTVRIRVANQVLENASFDLKSYFIEAVQKSTREALNFAAVSTAKATNTFYGGFAQSAESGTYGSSGYTAGKQTGTYTSLSKNVFAEMISKLAVRNIPLNNIAFVVGAEDYWTLKVTPVDAGSGIMLLGNDGKILGVPVVCNNAINRQTKRGAVSGHNIGLGNFGALPTLNHGNIRLSVDSGSAYASDTDETIITLNADYSMTVLKSMQDAFVVYSLTQADTEAAG